MKEPAWRARPGDFSPLLALNVFQSLHIWFWIAQFLLSLHHLLLSFFILITVFLACKLLEKIFADGKEVNNKSSMVSTQNLM